MNSLVKIRVCFVILFCGMNQVSFAVGPVEPGEGVMCVNDGVCHVNGCQATPDPDCELPDNSSSNEPSNGGTSNGTIDGTGNGGFNYTDLDAIKLTGNQVKFGNGTWDPVFTAPAGWGSVYWSIVDGFYTPRLTGYIHLNNASGKYGRMHLSYYYPNGVFLYARHGGSVYAPDGKHHHWSVDLSPLNPEHITEVKVCTEISDDGVNFSQVACKTVDFD